MFGDTTPTPYADFDQSVDPVNSYGQGSGGGDYTVRAGDTLQSLALMFFGDQSLWYRIAEANGLSGGSALVEGQRLTLPSGILTSGHSASTFKPYDAAEALGNLSPTTPKPSRRNGCGMIGLILMIAIAVAVTVVTSGAALAALSPGIGSVTAGIAALGTGLTATGTAIGAGTMIAAGAIGGAVGSLASQGFGIATGQQSKINWKGVGLAAIAGGIGGAMGPGGIFGEHGAFGGITNGVLKGALRGATSSAVTQGIGVATGLQDKFSWSGVAGAALAGGISGAIGGRFAALGSFGGNLARNAVGGLANAAARSLIDGTDFGDNVMAALPDIIGQTLGNWVADGIQSMGGDRGGGAGNGANAARSAADVPAAEGDSQDIVISGGGARRDETDAEYEARQAAVDADYQRRYAADDAAAAAASVTTSDAPPPDNLLDGIGDIRDMRAGASPYWMTYRDIGGSPSFPAWLELNHYIGNPDLNAAYAGDMIAATDFWHMERVILPVLEHHASANANVAQVRNIVRTHLDGLNAMADHEIGEMLRTVNPIIDNGLFVRDLINRDASNTEIALRGAGALLPFLRPLGRLGGKVVAPLVGRAARVLSRNGYVYHLDDLGRPAQISGRLKLNPAQGRSQTAQRAAGGADRLSTDQGGHFIARRFDGPLDDFNHFAQNQNFNQSAYARLENSWEAALNRGDNVSVDIRPVYQGNSLRPSALDIRYRINETNYRRIMQNASGRR
jgi:hypothetical protein